MIVRLAQPARDALVTELTAKGLTEAAIERADLAVNLHGQSLPKVEIQEQGFTYPRMTRYGMVTVVRNPYTTVSTSTERTLIVELLDNHAKEVVWVGWLKSESSRPVSPETLQEAIRKILAEFPPPASGATGKH